MLKKEFCKIRLCSIFISKILTFYKKVKKKNEKDKKKAWNEVYNKVLFCYCLNNNSMIKDCFGEENEKSLLYYFVRIVV